MSHPWRHLGLTKDKNHSPAGFQSEPGFVLVPLSSAENLHGLRHTSAIGLAALAYALLLIIIDAAVTPVSSTFSMQQVGGVETLGMDWGIFESMALYSHAFLAHYNVPRLYNELKERNLESWVLGSVGA